MNFLQLAQRVKRESGLSGGGPVSLSAAVGDDLRIFDWVNWANRDIALAHESWLWRRATAVGTTSAIAMPAGGAAPGFALTDFAGWKQETREYRPSAYRVSDGPQAERPLRFVPYDVFRSRFLTGVHQAGAAQFWSVSPERNLLIGPRPDSAHIVRADYYRAPVEMTADTAEPAMPAEHHLIIVWRALLEYGGFDAAAEVYQRADRNYRAMWSALAQSQLPGVRMTPRGFR